MVSSGNTGEQIEFHLHERKAQFVNAVRLPRSSGCVRCDHAQRPRYDAQCGVIHLLRFLCRPNLSVCDYRKGYFSGQVVAAVFELFEFCAGHGLQFNDISFDRCSIVLVTY